MPTPPLESQSARLSRKFATLFLLSAPDAEAIERILDDVIARRLDALRDTSIIASDHIAHGCAALAFLPWCL